MEAATVNVGGYVTEFFGMFSTFLKFSHRVNIVCGLKGKSNKTAIRKCTKTMPETGTTTACSSKCTLLRKNCTSRS